MPLISDDFPEPLTPVTTVNTFKGNKALTPRRLFMRAPVSSICLFQARRVSGTFIFSTFNKYFNV